MTDAVEEASGLDTSWRDVPTVFAEAVLGRARHGGVVRVMLGEIVFNEAIGATKPKFQPAINLAIPQQALPFIIEELQKTLDEANGAE